MLNKKSGFTLIELVMVIVILGILAVVAVPRFIDLRTDAQVAARDGVVGGVRAGISVAHASWQSNTNGTYFNGVTFTANGYPTSLDTALVSANASAAAPFFVNVLQSGVTDSRWYKNGTNATQYHYISGSNSYNYNNTTGTFQ